MEKKPVEERIQVRSKIWLEAAGRPVLGEGRRALLQAIEEKGSISEAARSLALTYRKAWGQIRFMEEQLGFPLVLKLTGGVGGGGARLTPEARELLAKYDRLIVGLQEQVNERFQVIFLGSVRQNLHKAFKGKILTAENAESAEKKDNARTQT